MVRFFLNKAFLYLFSSFVVITITFCFLHLIPGDPFTREMTLPAEMVQSLRHHYGLDRPFFVQYLAYLGNMFSFDFGPSLSYEGRTVFSLIQEALPLSFFMGILSSIIALSLGTSLGVFFAKSGKSRRKIALFSTLGLCIPSFVLAPFLQYLFSLKYSLFPTGRLEHWSGIVLPLCTLSFVPTFQIAKIVHFSIRSILQEDYVKTARAKGLSEKSIWRDHIRRNAMIPVIDYFVPLTSYLLMGSFVVERTFALPGLGQLMVSSIESRDYGCVMGLVVVYCLVLFCVEWCASTCKAYIDPRIQA
ncbi:MAG: ABC transporter permease [Chlamydiota bacterium]